MPIDREMAPRYPKDWAVRRRFIIQYRARNQCEWCGAENEQPHPITGGHVVLTLAHVWDTRPEMASLLNLAGLCQRCHNQWDAVDRAKSRIRKRISRLLRAGQLPLPLPPEFSLPMAIYELLLQTGQLEIPPGYHQLAIPAAAYEWVGAGAKTA